MQFAIAPRRTKSAAAYRELLIGERDALHRQIDLYEQRKRGLPRIADPVARRREERRLRLILVGLRESVRTIGNAIKRFNARAADAGLKPIEG